MVLARSSAAWEKSVVSQEARRPGYSRPSLQPRTRTPQPCQGQCCTQPGCQQPVAGSRAHNHTPTLATGTRRRTTSPPAHVAARILIVTVMGAAAANPGLLQLSRDARTKPIAHADARKCHGATQPASAAPTTPTAPTGGQRTRTVSQSCPFLPRACRQILHPPACPKWHEKHSATFAPFDVHCSSRSTLSDVAPLGDTPAHLRARGRRRRAYCLSCATGVLRAA